MRSRFTIATGTLTPLFADSIYGYRYKFFLQDISTQDLNMTNSRMCHHGSFGAGPQDDEREGKMTASHHSEVKHANPRKRSQLTV